MYNQDNPDSECFKGGGPRYRIFEICCCTRDCTFKGSETETRPSCNYDEKLHRRYIFDRIRGGNTQEIEERRGG